MITIPVSLKEELKARGSALALRGREIARKQVPAWIRRAPLPQAKIEDWRARLTDWLQDKAPSEVTLVFDGPGYGCTTMYYIFGLLGPERIAQLHELHAFSAASYATLCVLALHSGHFVWPMTKIDSWQDENQKRHRLRPGITLAKGIYAMARKKPAIFSADLLEEALTVTVSEEFANRKVRELPANIRFWTYNLTDRKFEAIHAGNPDFADLSLRTMIRATSAIPGLYEAFEHNGKQYIDPLWGPKADVSKTYRSIRESAKHCLFGHMARDGQKDNTLFLRLHDDRLSYRRLGIDFAYFMLNLHHPETMDNFKRGMLELAPIPLPPAPAPTPEPEKAPAAPEAPAGVSSTALIVARWRAEENEEAAPLFRDDYARLVEVPGIAEKADAIRARCPLVKTCMRYRTRFFDDEIKRFHEEGGRQIVILGAGLDFRSVRLAMPDLVFYEVDNAQVLTYKAEALRKAGNEYPSRVASDSYLDPAVWERLSALGLKREEPVAFLWEGNSFYLDTASISQLFQRLAAFPKARVLFDTMSASLVQGNSPVAMLNDLVELFRSLGAPWITGADDVFTIAKEHGFELRRSLLAPEHAAELATVDEWVTMLSEYAFSRADRA